MMLDARITIINGVMSSFDRKTKKISVIDHNNKQIAINFDILVLCVGPVDNTIKELAREKPKEKEVGKEKDKDKDKSDVNIANMKNVFSIDDPYIYEIFKRHQGNGKKDSNPIEMMTHKKRPQKINIYGRSINTLCFATGLINRGVDPKQITLILPPLSYTIQTEFKSNAERIEYDDNRLNDLDAFDGDSEVRGITFEVLKKLGVTIHEDYHISEIVPEETDKRQIRCLKLRQDRVENVKASKVQNARDGDKFKFNDDIEAPGSILVTASILDIEEKLFNTIQENGLVYNGRLIVKNNFQTVDDSIFACGKIVEFSQMYKNFALGRSLRLDRYSGRELGQRLGQCVLEELDIMAPIVESDPKYEKLPSFEMPIGICANLPGGLTYTRVNNVQQGLPDTALLAKKNRPELVSNNLRGGEGHYLKIGFDNNGMIKTVVYLGSEKVVTASLVALVGLNETYLNQLVERHTKAEGDKEALVDNVTEFLSENWAMALYHQWFSEFRFNLKQKIVDTIEMERMMRDVTEEAMKQDSYLSRDLTNHKMKDVPEDFRKIIRDDVLQFIRDNMNHLPMYYVPGTEFK